MINDILIYDSLYITWVVVIQVLLVVNFIYYVYDAWTLKRTNGWRKFPPHWDHRCGIILIVVFWPAWVALSVGMVLDTLYRPFKKKCKKSKYVT